MAENTRGNWGSFHLSKLFHPQEVIPGTRCDSLTGGQAHAGILQSSFRLLEKIQGPLQQGQSPRRI